MRGKVTKALRKFAVITANSAQGKSVGLTERRAYQLLKRRYKEVTRAG